MNRKNVLFWSLWLVGALFPSIVSTLCSMGSFTLPGGLIYVEFLVGMGLCVVVLLLCKDPGMLKLGGVLVAFALLALQVLTMGVLALRSSGLDGVQ